MTTTRWILAGVLVLAAATALAAPVTTSRLEVPLRLALEGTERGDEAVVTATLTVTGRLKVAPVLRVRLPEGATLAAGAVEEPLAVPADGGDVVRTFRVRGLAGRSLTVSADVVTRAAGAHAQATWPAVEKAPQAAPQVRAVPIRPVEVHGVRIDHAIPLTPAKKAP